MFNPYGSGTHRNPATVWKLAMLPEVTLRVFNRVVRGRPILKCLKKHEQN